METIEISSLNDYLSKIKKYDLHDYISRGESCKYKEIISSAFREITDNKNEYLETDCLLNFYNEVCNTITSAQRENFLAFAQHYGNPTCLVDFTESPLVSLYFACNNDTEPQGYVYFIKKSRLINISEGFYQCNNPSLFFSKNITNHFNDFTKSEAAIWEYILHSNCGNDNILNRAECLSTYSIDSMPKNYSWFYNEYAECLISLYKLLCNDDKLNDKGYVKKKTHNKKDIKSLQKYIIKQIGRIKTLNSDYSFIPFGTIISDLLSAVLNDIQHFSLLSDNSFYLPIYFSYTPPNIMERVNMQHSIFIYQLSFKKNYSKNSASLLNGEPYNFNQKNTKYQKIKPDYEIIVSNKEDILKDLDYLGINEKTIYSDYDHIANYIKGKLSKKKPQ